MLDDECVLLSPRLYRNAVHRANVMLSEAKHLLFPNLQKKQILRLRLRMTF
jgi:hypothetical protein